MRLRSDFGRNMFQVLRCVLAILVFMVAQAGLRAASPPLGSWTVSLETPDGPLEFGLQLESVNGESDVWIQNGIEKIPVQAAITEDKITLAFEHYDSNIELVRLADSEVFRGEWTKRRGADEVAHMKCEARPSKAFATGSATPFLGRWKVRFADSEDPAVAVFWLPRAKDGATDAVMGTFLTTTGDYRYLSGYVIDGQLKLFCFDGAHAFRFTASIDNQGALKGDFWSGNWYHDTWEAVADPNAELPDGFLQTTATEQTSLKELEFPNLDGRPQNLGDPELLGKVTLIEIFGSWCPNCHDAAAYLRDIRARYKERDVKVVGLAFELTGDLGRDTKQVQRYVDRFDIDYPVLIAGTSDKAEASKRLPMIDRLRSYPTTLFVDQAGKVRAVYTGFSGPATGEAHQELRKRFEAIIDSLLDE